MNIHSIAMTLLLAGVAAQDIGSVTETYRVSQAYPEGIAYDAANKRILLSSLGSNTIMAFDPANNMTLIDTYTPDTTNPSGMGLKVSADGHVYAAVGNSGIQDNGGLTVYDLSPSDADATTVSVANFPCLDGETKCGMANDVVVDDSGVAYVTDSAIGRVFKVENGEAELISDDEILRWTDVSSPYGANGLVHVPDLGILLVFNTQTAALLKVDLTSNEVTEVTIDGEINGGGDGMLLSSDGTLYAITGGSLITAFTTEDDWATATVAGTVDVSNGAEFPATMTFGETENEIYVTHVRLGDLFAGTPNADPSLISKVVLSSSESEPEESAPSEESDPEESAAAQDLGSVTETYRVSQFYPEGIAYDAANKRILLSSLGSNTIMAFDPANNMTLVDTYTPDTTNPSGMGLKVAPDGHVYAAVGNSGIQDNGGLTVYDLPPSYAAGVKSAIQEDGELEEYDLPAVATTVSVANFPCLDGETKCGMANDVVVDDSGVAYVTDSAIGRVFKVENGEAELISDDEILRWTDVSSPYGANGLVHVPDLGILLVFNTQTAALLKVDLTSNEVTEVTIDGEINGGGDGMLLSSDGTLYAITGGSLITAFTTEDDWATATVAGTVDVSNGAEFPATMAFGETENEIYVTHVRLGDLFAGTPNADPSLISKVVLSSSESEPEESASSEESDPEESAPGESAASKSVTVGAMGIVLVGLTAMFI